LDNSYKYRVWENLNHKKILTNNEIFFASAKSLNDPLELTNVLLYDKLSYDQKFNFLKSFYPFEKFPSAPDEVNEYIKDFLEEDAKNDFKKFKKFSTGWTLQYRKHCGILSLSTKPDINEQWLNYADSYRGFCVEFNYEALHHLLKGHMASAIDYVDKLPESVPTLDTMMDLFKISGVKLKKWQAESETRYMKMNFASKSKSIPSSVYSKIIIGSEMKPKSNDEIMKIINKKFKNVGLYVAIKSSDGKNNPILKRLN